MRPSGKAFKSQRGRRDHSRLRASVRAEDGVKVRVSRLDAARVGSRGLRTGDRVALEGEQKPSEIKVSKLERIGELCNRS
jgi:hypothetical protein